MRDTYIVPSSRYLRNLYLRGKCALKHLKCFYKSDIKYHYIMIFHTSFFDMIAFRQALSLNLFFSITTTKNDYNNKKLSTYSLHKPYNIYYETSI